MYGRRFRRRRRDFRGTVYVIFRRLVPLLLPLFGLFLRGTIFTAVFFAVFLHQCHQFLVRWLATSVGASSSGFHRRRRHRDRFHGILLSSAGRFTNSEETHKHSFFFFRFTTEKFHALFCGPPFSFGNALQNNITRPPLAKQRTIRNATRLSPGSDFTSARKDYKSLIFFSQIEQTRMCNGRRPARERFSGEPARECPVGVSAPGAKCGPRRNLTKCQKKKACRTVARRRRRLRKTAGLAAKCYTIAGLGQEATGANISVLFISK